MKNKTIRTIVILAAIVLGGLIMIQIVWVKNAYHFTTEQFNNKVSVALLTVANQVYQRNQDSSSNRAPVEQVTSNYFIVNINGAVDPSFLENLLRSEFREMGLPMDFQFAIYDCFVDSIIVRKHYVEGFSEQVKPEDMEPSMKTLSKINISKDSHKFGVFFPNKNNYVVRDMDIMILSTLGIGIVLFFFLYLVFIIFRQKRLSEMKEDFINNMTHEFKTPISTISVSVEALAKPSVAENPERLSNYARIIKEENNRLKSQVDRILQIAMLDATSKKLNMSAFSFHEMIREVMDKMKLLLDQKSCLVDVQLHATQDQVWGDRDHLMNVMFNLVDNALKYSRENPGITIITYNQGKKLFVEVKDKGIGIPKTAQKHVFEKFYRVPTGNVHNVKGFGLGLNYVKNIVESHGGKITLKSKEGQGSTFAFNLKIME